MTFLRTQWDRAAAWLAVALGALLLLLGYLGVSHTGYVFEQVPYVVSGGIGGLFLLGLGAVLWLSADLRDEWRKLDALEAALREQRPDQGSGA
jgi:protein-S-isoprenylcysteine O-methyltransferase Ste14